MTAPTVPGALSGLSFGPFEKKHASTYVARLANRTSTSLTAPPVIRPCGSRGAPPIVRSKRLS